MPSHHSLYELYSKKGQNKRGGPVSRVLCRGRLRRPRGAPSIWAGRCRPALAAYPQAGARLLDGPSTCCSALLLARFTVPPPSPATRWALTPPFHPHRQAHGAAARHRQYVFCGTFCPRRPRATRPGRYPAPCPDGARTFLHRCGPQGPSGGGAPARLSLSFRKPCFSRRTRCIGLHDPRATEWPAVLVGRRVGPALQHRGLLALLGVVALRGFVVEHQVLVVELGT